MGEHVGLVLLVVRAVGASDRHGALSWVEVERAGVPPEYPKVKPTRL